MNKYTMKIQTSKRKKKTENVTRIRIKIKKGKKRMARRNLE